MSRVPALGPRGEGWVVLQVVALALVALAAFLAPGAAADPSSALAVLGYLCIGAAAITGVAGIVVLRRARSLTAVPHPVDGGDLVETGPYRWIRHPIYAALILASLGATLIRASVPALVATVALAVILDLKRRREEAWLTERFEAYPAYRDRTRAFIPFVY